VYVSSVSSKFGPNVFEIGWLDIFYSIRLLGWNNSPSNQGSNWATSVYISQAVRIRVSYLLRAVVGVEDDWDAVCGGNGCVMSGCCSSFFQRSTDLECNAHPRLSPRWKPVPVSYVSYAITHDFIPPGLCSKLPYPRSTQRLHGQCIAHAACTLEYLPPWLIWRIWYLVSDCVFHLSRMYVRWGTWHRERPRGMRRRWTRR
jgi:hypothetical protein